MLWMDESWLGLPTSRLPCSSSCQEIILNTSTSMSLLHRSLRSLAQEEEIAVPSVQAHIYRCRRVWRETHVALQRDNTRAEQQANRHRTAAPEYTVGQQVWLSTADIPIQASSKKLQPRYIGPYPVESVINSSAIRLRLPTALKVHPVFHTSQFKPVRTSPLSPPTVAPPPARIIDDHPAFTVRKILDIRRRGRGYQYLVD